MNAILVFDPSNDLLFANSNKLFRKRLLKYARANRLFNDDEDDDDDDDDDDEGEDDDEDGDEYGGQNDDSNQIRAKQSRTTTNSNRYLKSNRMQQQQQQQNFSRSKAHEHTCRRLVERCPQDECLESSRGRYNHHHHHHGSRQAPVSHQSSATASAKRMGCSLSTLRLRRRLNSTVSFDDTSQRYAEILMLLLTPYVASLRLVSQAKSDDDIDIVAGVNNNNSNTADLKGLRQNISTTKMPVECLQDCQVVYCELDDFMFVHLQEFKQVSSFKMRLMQKRCDWFARLAMLLFGQALNGLRQPISARRQQQQATGAIRVDQRQILRQLYRVWLMNQFEAEFLLEANERLIVSKQIVSLCQTALKDLTLRLNSKYCSSSSALDDFSQSSALLYSQETSSQSSLASSSTRKKTSSSLPLSAKPLRPTEDSSGCIKDETRAALQNPLSANETLVHTLLYSDLKLVTRFSSKSSQPLSQDDLIIILLLLKAHLDYCHTGTSSAARRLNGSDDHDDDDDDVYNVDYDYGDPNDDENHRLDYESSSQNATTTTTTTTTSSRDSGADVNRVCARCQRRRAVKMTMTKRLSSLPVVSDNHYYDYDYDCNYDDLNYPSNYAADKRTYRIRSCGHRQRASSATSAGAGGCTAQQVAQQRRRRRRLLRASRLRLTTTSDFSEESLASRTIHTTPLRRRRLPLPDSFVVYLSVGSSSSASAASQVRAPHIIRFVVLTSGLTLVLISELASAYLCKHFGRLLCLIRELSRTTQQVESMDAATSETISGREQATKLPPKTHLSSIKLNQLATANECISAVKSYFDSINLSQFYSSSSASSLSLASTCVVGGCGGGGGFVGGTSKRGKDIGLLDKAKSPSSFSSSSPSHIRQRTRRGLDIEIDGVGGGSAMSLNGKRTNEDYYYRFFGRDENDNDYEDDKVESESLISRTSAGQQRKRSSSSSRSSTTSFLSSLLDRCVTPLKVNRAPPVLLQSNQQAVAACNRYHSQERRAQSRVSMKFEAIGCRDFDCDKISPVVQTTSTRTKMATAKTTQVKPIESQVNDTTVVDATGELRRLWCHLARKLDELASDNVQTYMRQTFRLPINVQQREALLSETAQVLRDSMDTFVLGRQIHLLNEPPGGAYIQAQAALIDEARMFMKEQLGDYMDYLAIKSQRNVTLGAPLTHDMPAISSFIYVDRARQQVILAPAMDSGASVRRSSSETNAADESLTCRFHWTTQNYDDAMDGRPKNSAAARRLWSQRNDHTEAASAANKCNGSQATTTNSCCRNCCCSKNCAADIVAAADETETIMEADLVARLAACTCETSATVDDVSCNNSDDDDYSSSYCSGGKLRSDTSCGGGSDGGQADESCNDDDDEQHISRHSAAGSGAQTCCEAAVATKACSSATDPMAERRCNGRQSPPPSEPASATSLQKPSSSSSLHVESDSSCSSAANTTLEAPIWRAAKATAAADRADTDSPNPLTTCDPEKTSDAWPKKAEQNRYSSIADLIGKMAPQAATISNKQQVDETISAEESKLQQEFIRMTQNKLDQRHLNETMDSNLLKGFVCFIYNRLANGQGSFTSNNGTYVFSYFLWFKRSPSTSNHSEPDQLIARPSERRRRQLAAKLSREFRSLPNVVCDDFFNKYSQSLLGDNRARVHFDARRHTQQVAQRPLNGQQTRSRLIQLECHLRELTDNEDNEKSVTKRKLVRVSEKTEEPIEEGDESESHEENGTVDDDESLNDFGVFLSEQVSRKINQKRVPEESKRLIRRSMARKVHCYELFVVHRANLLVHRSQVAVEAERLARRLAKLVHEH